jgi:aminoglycoside 3'-phosphotransferase-2
MDGVALDLPLLLETHRHELITLGMSGAAVYYFPDLSAYLKSSKLGGFSELHHEKEVLAWLAGKLPAPKLLGYEKTSEAEYLLTSAIAGIPASDILSAETSTVESELRFAAEAARMLRRMHDLPIDGCELDQSLDIKFARARKNIERKLLSESDAEFAIEHDGKSPIDVYKELFEARPADRDLVFTHGDPCMPNIIIDGDEIAGFIDLDGGGVADRYTDIAIFFRSFRRNCHVEVNVEETFCDAYGLDGLDRDKLEFYTYLDDLF